MKSSMLCILELDSTEYGKLLTYVLSLSTAGSSLSAFLMSSGTSTWGSLGGPGSWMLSFEMSGKGGLSMVVYGLGCLVKDGKWRGWYAG